MWTGTRHCASPSTHAQPRTSEIARKSRFGPKGTHISIMRLSLSPVVVAILLSGCAHPPGAFRLQRSGNNTVLIPPGVRDAGVAIANVQVTGKAQKTVCAPSSSGLELRGRKIRVTHRTLDAATADELNTWLAKLESSGCISTTEAATLLSSLVDSLPLDVKQRVLLRGEPLAIRGAMDLTKHHSLRVVSPVFRPGSQSGSVTTSSPAVVAAGASGGLNVEMKANPDLTGYEIAWYDVVAATNGPGLRIIPRSAELHIGNTVEPNTRPQKDPFLFASDARFFRYFLMTRSSQNNYNIVLLSAPSAAELAARSTSFRQDATAWLQTANDSAVAMPRDIGVNPFIRISINGKITDIQPGTTLRHALEGVAKCEKPEAIVNRMSLQKPYLNGLAPVTWTNASEILALPLEGGEVLTWR